MTAAVALRLRSLMAARDAFAGRDLAGAAAQASAAAAAAFEVSWRMARARVEDEAPLACRAGCDACCFQHVAILPIEAIAIAAALDRDRDEGPGLRARLAGTDAKTHDLDAPSRRRARIPCAFLGAEGRCEIYEIRPIRCRGLHSRDAELCRWQTDQPDQAMAERGQRTGPHRAFPVEPMQLADAALAGLAAACAERGIAHDAVELAHAVQLLIFAPARAHAVLTGADQLAEARLDVTTRPMAKR